MNTRNQINVLVSPLNWGAGHATRCIPIVRELKSLNATVTVACASSLQCFFTQEFNGITFETLPELKIHYGKKVPVWLSLLFQTPKFIRYLLREHNAIKTLQNHRHFDAIISDNRYGLWTKKTTNILITHQVNLNLPKLLKWWPINQMIQKANTFLIERFDQCWIPDIPPPNQIAGFLSVNDSIRIPCQYIGILSRFTPRYRPEKNHLLILISGPEPQRSILIKKILSQIYTVKIHVHLVIHSTLPFRFANFSNLTVHSYPSPKFIEELILESKYIIARAGYTTIMELIALNKRALLVPTPGQTEQEYLANHALKFGFATLLQEKLNLSESIKLLQNLPKERTKISTGNYNPLINQIKRFVEILEQSR